HRTGARPVAGDRRRDRAGAPAHPPAPGATLRAVGAGGVAGARGRGGLEDAAAAPARRHAVRRGPPAGRGSRCDDSRIRRGAARSASLAPRGRGRRGRRRVAGTRPQRAADPRRARSGPRCPLPARTPAPYLYAAPGTHPAPAPRLTRRIPMQRNFHVLLLALCTAMASTPLFAATPIDQTRPLAADGSIEIDNLKGRIQVRAWDRNEVRITGSLGEGVEKLVVDGNERRLEVKGQYPSQIGAWRSDRTGPTDLQLMVPLRANLEIESGSADIDVDGVAPRELEIDTVSGNVTVAAAPGRAEV